MFLGFPQSETAIHLRENLHKTPRGGAELSAAQACVCLSARVCVCVSNVCVDVLRFLTLTFKAKASAEKLVQKPGKCSQNELSLQTVRRLRTRTSTVQTNRTRTELEPE